MHEEFLELAEELINDPEDGGRAITFIQLSKVAGAFPGEPAGDPRSPPARSLQAIGVFVEPDSLQRLGHTTKIDELIQRSDNICLVAGTNPLEGYNEIIDDDGAYYVITGIEKLRPGTRTLLYFVGLKR